VKLINRPYSPRSIQCSAAKWLVFTIPSRCTRRTLASDSGVTSPIVSRTKLPAQLTRMSSLPHVASGLSTRSCASSHDETSATAARAVPPAATISSTTASAGSPLLPLPSTPLPLSATTTVAPSRAKRRGDRAADAATGARHDRNPMVELRRRPTILQHR